MIVFRVEDSTIVVIGAGHLGTGVIDALYQKGHQKVIATRRDQEKLKELSQQYGIQTTTNNVEAIEKSDVVVVTVKPKVLDDLLKDPIGREIAYVAREKLVITVAAARSIAQIEAVLDASRVCRVMTGIYVAEEIAAYTLGSRCTHEDATVVKYIFGDRSREVKEAGLADRTWIACYNGLMGKEIEYQIAALPELQQDEARRMVGAMLEAMGKQLQRGVTGHKIFDAVAGPGSFTGKLYEVLREAGVYDKLVDSVKRTVEACIPKT